MKAKELRELSIPELKERVAKLREELMNLRFQKTIHRLENPMRIRQVRREIARVLTILKEKERSANQ
ncbi:MAG: 50S ribosomal protein L29 [Thermodesulfobacterium sp.]|jgi:large subunit ribosomal protein L29|nr:50S ribosomal protein L29 [Thermodesulfobacterium sp.]